MARALGLPLAAGLAKACEQCGLTLQQRVRLGRCVAAGMDGVRVLKRLLGTAIMPSAERKRFDDYLDATVVGGEGRGGGGAGTVPVPTIEVFADANNGGGGGGVATSSGGGGGQPPAAHNTRVAVRVGGVAIPRSEPRRPELVPRVAFVEIPEHVRLLRELTEDVFVASERFLMLLGPQGVGKNRVVDYFLQLARVEREYMQLHRDTTVTSLTQTPVVDGSRGVVWQDSPLVRAARAGRTVVIDEADKAPLEVIVVLKSLANDGYICLADGTRVGKAGGGEHDEPLHPAFSMILLANRPGFPFLGNDVFSLLASTFSTHVLGNADPESEYQLASAVAPNVPELVVRDLQTTSGQRKPPMERNDENFQQTSNPTNGHRKPPMATKTANGQ